MVSLKTIDAIREEQTITAAEMRALEATAMSSGGVESLALMETAGEGVAAAITAKWPGATGKAVVLCGPGNNGGDGYVVARLLAATGWDVEVFALGEPERLPQDAHANYERVAEHQPVAALSKAPEELKDADLVVDALFGIGLTRGLDNDVGTVLSAVPKRARRVAIDVPSGFDTDGAGVLGHHAFEADLVVTFHRAKPLHAELSKAGVDVMIADIGL